MVNLRSLDGKPVRVTDEQGDQFDGECEWFSAEYAEHEYGRPREGLQIDEYLFFKGQIRRVETLDDGHLRLWHSRPMHTMHLSAKPYRLIEEQKKTVEARLLDEKRRAVRPGDYIRFVSTADESEVLHVRVEEVLVFPSFAEMYRSIPLTELGYAEDEAASASPADMNRYYTPEEQAKYGAAAIRLCFDD